MHLFIFFKFILSHILTYYFCCQCMHGPKCKIGKFCSVGTRIQQVNVLGGVILPVWGNIDKALSKQVFYQSIKHSWERTYFADIININFCMMYQFVNFWYPLDLIVWVFNWWCCWQCENCRWYLLL